MSSSCCILSSCASAAGSLPALQYSGFQEDTWHFKDLFSAYFSLCLSSSDICTRFKIVTALSLHLTTSPASWMLPNKLLVEEILLFLLFFFSSTLYQTIEFEYCYWSPRRCVQKLVDRSGQRQEKMFQCWLLDIWWEQLWGWGQSVSSANAICFVPNADCLAYLTCHRR